MPTKFQGYGRLRELEDIRNCYGIEFPYAVDRMLPYFGGIISGEFETSDSVEVIRINQPDADNHFWWNKKWFHWIKDEQGNLLCGELTEDDHSKEIQDMFEDIMEEL